MLLDVWIKDVPGPLTIEVDFDDINLPGYFTTTRSGVLEGKRGEDGPHIVIHGEAIVAMAIHSGIEPPR